MNNPINSLVNLFSDNLQSYKKKFFNSNISTKKNKTPILGYETGEQGWYDVIGGGPCNKYCRYVGINPNVKWFCSDENDLSDIKPIDKNETGFFCYGYDKKTKTPNKKGIVVNGNFLHTELNNKNNILDNSNTLEINDINVKECENICQNSDKCKAFNYIENKCILSKENIKPLKHNTENIVGNKKQMPKIGTYNIYHNNSCIDSRLFENIKFNTNKETCNNNLTNNFVFGNNNEIITDILNNENSALCLQNNFDKTVSKKNCNSGDNQKWFYDDNLHSLKNFYGECLTIKTKNNNLLINTEKCNDDNSQKFHIKEVKNYENFNNENNNNNSKYFLYLIILIIMIILLFIIIKK
jgi:hypothetical protein